MPTSDEILKAKRLLAALEQQLLNELGLDKSADPSTPVETSEGVFPLGTLCPSTIAAQADRDFKKICHA